LASGSWNSDCKIWKSKSGKDFTCVATLSDHAYAVQCLFLSNGLLVTGSQDGHLNLFDQTGELINRKEGAHLDIIRKIKEYRVGDVSKDTGFFDSSKSSSYLLISKD
jgi:WD40 repeat protein